MIISYRCLLLAFTGLALVESKLNSTNDGANECVRKNNGPLITPCVSEITLQKGQNFTLTCKGVTKLRFRQQDVSEEVTSNFTIVNTSTPIHENEYNFQRTLDLLNVDQYAIGYYACSDESVDEDIVNKITEEPENNEHVSYIYVYVNGTGSLFAPMTELILSRCNKILIECRPSTPDVEVSLTSTKSQNKTPKYSPKIGFILKKCDSFAYICRGQRGAIIDKKRIQRVQEPPTPVLEEVPARFLKGDNFTLICTANITINQIVKLSWKYPVGLPQNEIIVKEDTNAGYVTQGVIYKKITIFNATIKHAGYYLCLSSSNCENKESNKVYKEFVEKPFLNMTLKNRGGITLQHKTSLSLDLDAHPELTSFRILKDGVDLPYNKTDKFILIFQNSSASVLLRIDPVTVTDMANYTFIASNGNITKSQTYQLRVKGIPEVKFGESNVTCLKGTKHSFRCDVSGYPLPKVSWLLSYKNETLNVSSTSEEALLYNKTAFLDLQQCDREGSISCTAGSDTKTRELFVYEITDGFGILTKSENKQTWVLENDIVSLKCLASTHIFSNVTWEIDNEIYSRAMVEHPPPTDLSLVAELKIDYIPVDHSGIYKCVGTKHDGSNKEDSIQINVLKLQPPAIVGKPVTEEEVFRFDSMRLNCTVMGAPLPHIEWFQDGKHKATNFSNVKIYQNNLDLTTINSTIYIEKMQPENVGEWECVAKGRDYIQRKSFTLKLKVEKESSKSVMHYLIAIAVIIIILIILIVYLTVKIKKEKRFRKELAAAGLLYFKEGVINSLNPDLGIDEQAELLPYDEKFEFPREKLNLGIQLGAGAFGIVYKAEARGIINAEETTTVAVKMVKKTADNMYIKALASELKIMVHLGKHINIVNLLGACTKNVVKRELVVIVEYCKYGNIHNYMQRHREVFIDQLDTGNKDKLGTVNRAYTTSTGSTGVNSEYFGSSNTQDTDHTFVNTANTVRSARKNCPNNQQTEEVKASEGYVQPEWRSNYESDYSYDGRSPRPLSSRDLLAWSFQIARGMEYLASRKVLHGDLAARNILLADDNIVKICDFGLAKSIYKNDEYQKKENCPLPVKWLAIECMTDRIFSTQSDVWSFGIVLWELFTLAKTPYPNIHPTSLLPFLSEGHRLNKPAYADDRLYDVMKRCWEAKPLLRPTFSQLQELLGTFLEDNVRNHYVDLNSTYMDKNAKVGSQEDYLAMMCAPDYNNLVTPSPHHYVNTDTQKSFFPPTPVKVDDEGYLQMSPTNQGIFSPRNPNSEFDFDLDPRKFNAKTSDAGSCGSELTPMLTLNNLPARSGSESDHEGNAPYLNVCTPIEEVDEVFAPTFNETKNAKNMQQSAVTNPTYITFDNINEKPKDIINYVNINVPNGLVK